MSAKQIMDAKQAYNFMMAGKAKVTFVSEKTQVRFTFQVKKGAEDRSPHFVALLSGSDNESDFAYLGTVFERATFVHGRKSRIAQNAPSAQAFAYVWRHLSAGVLPPSCQVWHEGTCGRCGRSLTVPSSIASGLGPECEKMGG
jgi:hypothetical protein